jgi:N-acetylglutamate synthase
MPATGVDASVAAAVLRSVFEGFVSRVPGGWVRAERDALAAVSGVDLAGMNGVWVDSTDPSPQVVSGLLDEVRATGLVHCLQARGAAAARLQEMAAGRGMTPAEPVPLMVLFGRPDVRAAQPPGELVIRQLTPAEAALHVQVLADGFEAPADPFAALMAEQVLAAPGLRCYLGEVAGRPVTTGLGITEGPYVFVGNIATPPAERRRGYGAAATVQAVADGLADGAGWALLQSSPAGYRTYQRLGFRTVDEWSCWLSAAPAA